MGIGPIRDELAVYGQWCEGASGLLGAACRFTDVASTDERFAA